MRTCIHSNAFECVGQIANNFYSKRREIDEEEEEVEKNNEMHTHEVGTVCTHPILIR